MRSPDFSLNRLLLRSDAARPPVRVGVAIDDCAAAPGLAGRILSDILSSDFAQLVCIVTPGSPAVVTPANGASWQSWAYEAYLRWVDVRQRGTPDPLQPTDCTGILRDVPRVPLADTGNGSDTSADAIQECQLDVIVSFSQHFDASHLRALARHGVWTWRYGDTARYPGDPPLFGEILDGNPLSVAELLCTAPDGTVSSLSRAVLSSTKTLSVSANRFSVCWSTEHVVIQKLRELHQSGGDLVARDEASRPSIVNGVHAPAAPGNLRVARWLVPAIGRAVRARIQEGKERVHWRIALRQAAEPLHQRPKADTLRQFRWLESPAGRFWADPCLFEHGGQTWAFIEEGDHAIGRAHIACGRIDEQGNLSDVRTVLDTPYHLSYPQVFEHDGAVWMIPESRQAGQVQLFRAHRFPDVWKLECPLLDLRAIDPTPLRWQGRWWMFASPDIVSSQCASTWLFSAPSLTGPWSPHPAHAVSTDVRWARGAGRIFEDEGRLFRPSQDCSRLYGYSISFNEITRLDDRDYREVPGEPLLPGFKPRLRGLHTYSRAGAWEAIDGQYLERSHARGGHLPGFVV